MTELVTQSGKILRHDRTTTATLATLAALFLLQRESARLGCKKSVCLFPILNREPWGIEGQALLLTLQLSWELQKQRKGPVQLENRYSYPRKGARYRH